MTGEAVGMASPTMDTEFELKLWQIVKDRKPDMLQSQGHELDTTEANELQHIRMNHLCRKFNLFLLHLYFFR